MNKSIFYHAGCPVCVSVEQDIINLIGTDNVEVVHFGENKNRIEEAEKTCLQKMEGQTSHCTRRQKVRPW